MKFKTPKLQTQWQEHFAEPTAVQEALFEPAKSGQSLWVSSPTGTGKTLAYLLPILDTIEPNHQVQAIILAPSQELAMQIYQVASTWAKALGVTVQSLTGGANMKRQLDRLKQKPEIVVGTMGRLNEILTQSRKLKVHTTQTLVIDEADHFFDEDQGQMAQLSHLIQRLSQNASILCVSATSNPAAFEWIQQYRTDLTMMRIEQDANASVEHIYLTVGNRQKTNVLRSLAHLPDMQAICFFEQIDQLERVAAKLTYENIAVSKLHGQMSTQERKRALQSFHDGKTTFLLTTDLASRGLDIASVPAVVHYHRAQDRDTYVHRSGRTGRMGAPGIVISLGNEQEIRDLKKLLEGEYDLSAFALYQGALMPASLMEQEQRQQKSIKKAKPKNKKGTKKTKKKRKK